MFLLIREWLLRIQTQGHFTFHDVSINTETEDFCDGDDELFTFHDVSINTPREDEWILSRSHFTFHDVSINTRRLFILTIQI